MRSLVTLSVLFQLFFDLFTAILLLFGDPVITTSTAASEATHDGCESSDAENKCPALNLTPLAIRTYS